MRYHTRQKLKQGCKLATERIVYQIKHLFAGQWIFLRSRVNWHKVTGTGTNRRNLYDYSRVGKFNHIQYLINQSDIDWYKSEKPFENQHEIIAEADKILHNNIHILGVGRVSYKNKIDWHREPRSGKSFPSNLFSSHPDIKIDRRFLTELNLHRHFPVLAIAWLLSGEQRYAKALIDQLLDWIRQNPPVSDPFISDGLELAARVVCWTHCLILLQDFPIDVQDYLEILERIDTYGTLIDSQYNVSGSLNNHQIAEAFGLFYIGVMYPELKGADRRKEKGLFLLAENLKYQFLDGGVHSEQSVTYHMFVMECYLMTILLCKVNNIELSDDYIKIISKAADFLMALNKPMGKLPMLGDTAFRLFCPTGDASYEPKQLISIVGTIVKKNALIDNQNDRFEEVFWLTGKDKLYTTYSENGSPGIPTTKLFPEAGHIVVNPVDDKLSQYLYFKCGPQGLGKSAGHGHDDALNIEYSAMGEEFLVDPGTYTYSAINPLRRYFMGARAHSTVMIGGEAAAQPSDGAFGWEKTVNGELLEVASSAGVAWIRGQHRGYEGEQGALVVERSLLFVQSSYLLIIDRVLGVGAHQIESRLHFHPDIELHCGTDVVEARGKKNKLIMLTTASEGVAHSIHRGADDLQPGWYSGQYGKLQESSVLRSSASFTLPYWQVTGLFPCKLDLPQSQIPMLSVKPEPGLKENDTHCLKLAINMGAMIDNIEINFDQINPQAESSNVGTMSLLRESEDNSVLYINSETASKDIISGHTPKKVTLLERLFCHSE